MGGLGGGGGCSECRRTGINPVPSDKPWCQSAAGRSVAGPWLGASPRSHSVGV